MINHMRIIEIFVVTKISKVLGKPHSAIKAFPRPPCLTAVGISTYYKKRPKKLFFSSFSLYAPPPLNGTAIKTKTFLGLPLFCHAYRNIEVLYLCC